MKLQGTMTVNEKGHLVIGGCDTVELAREFGTPLYVMDEEFIRQNCKAYYESFTGAYPNSEVIYASKAFLAIAMCNIIEEEGLGLDVVSGGELYTALKAKFPTGRIYFHGNNKSPEEIRMALEANIGRFVVDNTYEMDLLNSIAGEMNKKANILIRITPGIEAHTHEYIQTGQIDSKFGLVLSNGQAMEGIKKALGLENLILKGLHCHIGSQIFELQSYQHAAEVMMEYIQKVTAETGVEITELNLGGGFGIYYSAGDRPASIKTYATIVMETVQRKAREFNINVPKVIVEPGRSIVGAAGTTLYTIGSVKDIPGVRKYVAVDGGMADNPRPALYQARYEALVANKADQPKNDEVSIAGKCCESGDMLIWDLAVPEVEPGDILAVSCTGAYNYSMASNYNRLTKPAVVLVNRGNAELIVRRETYEDLVQNDIVPERFKKNKKLTIAK
ncbi:diaminopimelate decarboxylase [Thermincola potens]|uniref:Diaminopimelate decarboxylase n=1 Tax=Thermincola potens (strain JR) TaxID=635013 RepID=D5X7C0_THEPJ|nr:diaminopimelate decarboxylase [Thermincola potens]ADG82490.1 diaminopimelate decarboxylase [Thermincola potens JR]